MEGNRNSDGDDGWDEFLNLEVQIHWTGDHFPSGKAVTALGR